MRRAKRGYAEEVAKLRQELREVDYAIGYRTICEVAALAVRRSIDRNAPDPGKSRERISAEIRKAAIERRLEEITTV